MYKILLCHRRQKGLGYSQLHRHWKEQRSRLVLDLREQLGFSRYAQLHQLSRGNLIGQAVRLSRSAGVSALIAAMQGGEKPAKGDRHARHDERWDVVDEFSYPSKEGLIQALTSAAGVDAVRLLVEDHTPRARHTAAIITEEFVAAEDTAASSPRIAIMFCIRSARNMTRQEMQGYWETSHKQLTLSVQRNLKFSRLVQLHARSDPGFSPVLEILQGSVGEEFDGAALLGYASQRKLVLALSNPRALAANIKLVRDEATFIDLQRSTLVFGEEHRFA